MMDAWDDIAEGLGKDVKDEWPEFTKKDRESKTIDLLKPGSDRHKRVLAYLMERINSSERAMNNFYSRWQVNEKKYQAYITLTDWEKQLKAMNDSGEAPTVVHITVPYSFATISTIVTYLIHTFAGRRPIFQVGSNQEGGIDPARKMETVLQYNADHTKLVKHLFQFLLDGQIYGVSILRNQWKSETKLRTVWKDTKSPGFMGLGGKDTRTKVREYKITYEGNDVCCIDPFMFLPDPRVPMSEVNRKGEFVFWRSFEGKHDLLKQQAAGHLKWVKAIPAMGGGEKQVTGDSARASISGGESQPGRNGNYNLSSAFAEIHQGSIEIIPAELGLGDAEVPEKWLFSIANKAQIIQAEPLMLDHDMHPVVVSEPYTMGYGFGHAGMSDYLAPFQDLLSWFMNSHMDNVKAALNNMWLLDPSRVEMQDLKRPGPGKIVRLKKAAYGQDVGTALQQLQVTDVTQSHPRDFELIMKMADSLSSVTDNLRGLQDSGGRKTATEVRTTGEAGASRLAALGKLISSQALVDLTEQQSLNIQQNLSQEFYLSIVGQEGLSEPIQITPEMLVGDFNYPVNDGTLPTDRVAMLDVWKEIFLGVAQNQALSARFDTTEIFKYVAELGGAKNISKFEIKPNFAPDAEVEAQAQAGNLIPTGGGGQTPGVVSNPGARAAGGI